MKPDKAQKVVDICATAAVSDIKDQLIAFLTDNTVPLLSSIRSYVLRMGLAKGEALPAAALDVLQEVVVEALDHCDRFDPTRQPMAWLLGIAMNVIKRKKVEAAKYFQRELSIGQFATPEPMSGFIVSFCLCLLLGTSSIVICETGTIFFLRGIACYGRITRN